MGLRLRSPKFLAALLVSGACLCFVTVFVLSGEAQRRPHEVRPPRIVGNISLDFRYNYILQYMGYPPLRARSKEDKVVLQRFFSSVRHFSISPLERQVFIELLGQFQNFCEQNKLPFFLFFGGLLGAFRHHGFVPWDDDLDVLMPLEVKPKLQVLLSEHVTLASSEKESFVVLVFLRDPKKSLPSYGRSWSWPYIEVHFYELHKGQILHRFDMCGVSVASDVFPLIQVPFENLTVPAPRKMDCLVRQCYDNSETRCCTNAFDHRRDMQSQEGGRCVDCKLLYSVFPFVFSRSRHGEYVKEHLSLNGSHLRTKWVKKPDCALGSQFIT